MKHGEKTIASGERFHAILSRTTTGTVVVDGNERIEFVNAAFVKAFALPKPPESYIGWPSERFLSQVKLCFADPDRMGARIHEVIADDVLVVGEEAELRNGHIALIDFVPLSIGRMWVHHDITERRRMEEARSRYEERLRASQKMEAIGSLAGGIAHDINNHLAVILSYTGFCLNATEGRQELQEDLAEVRNAANRAASLVRQLLAFSRRQVLAPVPLDLNRVVIDLEKMLRRIVGEDVRIVRNLAPDLRLTMADPSQIEQVVMNLVVNARDAMPSGGRLTIETANVSIGPERDGGQLALDPGEYVVIKVGDTGTGMDESTMARIFEPFFTTKEKGKGTGLGLSTVQGIVKQSGGDVAVTSSPGRGTTFRVLLPRTNAKIPTSTKPPAAPSRLSGNETVLVVEDEEPVCHAARRILEGAGYRVLAVSGFDEALEIVSSYREEIHVLLTDVVLPQQDGQELARRIESQRPGIRVVYMSGYAHNPAEKTLCIAPGTVFVSKPFDAVNLTRKIREAIDWEQDELEEESVEKKEPEDANAEQIRAARPAQLAREVLGEALGRIQDIRDPRLDVGAMTASVAKAVGALYAVQSSEPHEETHREGVSRTMEQLRVTLGQLQEIGDSEPALTGAAKAIAKALAILYPVARVQQRQSLVPGAPPAVIRAEISHDPRRSVPRFSIDTEIGFQSDTNFFTGFTEDVSEGGLFVATYDCRQLGDPVSINFTLPDGHLVSAEGVVRWIREYHPASPDVMPGMGVQFTSLRQEDREEINRFLVKREPMFFE